MSGVRPGPAPDVSIVIPTLNGGAELKRCLQSVGRQKTARTLEVICVDSGSAADDLETMRDHGVRVIPIDKDSFDHGLTRDLGASRARGETLVFLSQDAVPVGEEWLETLLQPLADHRAARIAAVQGAIAENPEADGRFYWDSCGPRFYFTSESVRWIARYHGIGFSTVHCAISRAVWALHPFGRFPILEDKKWQKEVVEAGFEIAVAPEALVYHTHDYGLRTLVDRCRNEGFGWRCLGESYSLRAALKDMGSRPTLKDWKTGVRTRKITTSAEFLFPWLRPLALYWGNRFSTGISRAV